MLRFLPLFFGCLFSSWMVFQNLQHAWFYRWHTEACRLHYFSNRLDDRCKTVCLLMNFQEFCQAVFACSSNLWSRKTWDQTWWAGVSGLLNSWSCFILLIYSLSKKYRLWAVTRELIYLQLEDRCIFLQISTYIGIELRADYCHWTLSWKWNYWIFIWALISNKKVFIISSHIVVFELLSFSCWWHRSFRCWSICIQRFNADFLELERCCLTIGFWWCSMNRGISEVWQLMEFITCLFWLISLWTFIEI